MPPCLSIIQVADIELQRLWYCVPPNTISRSLQSRIGLRTSASTSAPRLTVGLALIRSNQAFRCR
jgi:hypothetical protein